jgi:hypothetical protein
MSDPFEALENAVLRILPNNDFYHGLSRIARDAGIDKEDARFICQRLRNKGLAKYSNGLMNEDGEVAGSGYAITDCGSVRVQ